MYILNAFYKKGLELAVDERLSRDFDGMSRNLPTILEYQDTDDYQTHFIIWAIMLSILRCPLSNYNMKSAVFKRTLSSFIANLEIPDEIIQEYHKRVFLYKIFMRYSHLSVLKFLEDESVYIEVLKDENSDDGESRLTKILFDKSAYDRYVITILYLKDSDTFIYKNVHFTNICTLRNSIESDLRKRFVKAKNG